MASLVGQMIGRYKILEQLGEGGMATVYKAQDTILERYVAIKVIRADQFSPNMLGEMMRRFEREAKALAKLSHPNIVQVYDYGEYQGAPYLVMEYLPSGTLRNRPDNPMPWREALNLLIPIAEALEYAHEHGIIHRDIKPGNILLTDKGRPMLSDFGIAKLLESADGSTLTGTGMSIGTPEYMAPEQWTGAASPQSDIYSLGSMLFELLTGKKPYHADTPVSIMLKQMNEPPPRPTQFVSGLPDGLEEVVLKALQREPQDRYASMSDFAAAMEQFTHGQTHSQLVTSNDAGTGKTILAQGSVGAQAGSSKSPSSDAEKTSVTPSPQPSVNLTTKKDIPPSRKLRRWIPLGAVVMVLCIGSIFGVSLILRGLRHNVPTTGQPTTTAQSSENQNVAIIPTSTQVPATAASTQPPAVVTSVLPPKEIKVLWDISHGPRLNENSIPYSPDGAYKALVQAMANDHITITSGDLSNLNSYDVLVISESSGKTVYSKSETDAIESFVRTSGHGLLILSDKPALENLAFSVAQRFSINLGEITTDGTIQLSDEPFFADVASLAFLNGGGMFQVTAPAQVAAKDLNGNALIAYCQCDAGRVLAVADTNLWDQNGLSQGDNQRFAVDAFDWLAGVNP